MSPDRAKRVIGYGRVSTEEQENNYSLDAQRARFEVLCKQNNWTPLGFFPETGSGTSVLGRPVLCQILQRVQQENIDALWVKETDRLSRPENLGDLTLISQALESTHTHLIVDSRTLDLSEDNSVLMLDFEGVLAKHFRRQLMRNLNRGRMRKAELGRKAAGGDIFGYTTNEKGEYVPEPGEAKIVQLIFKLAMADYTFRKIIAELKRRGIQTKRGRSTWSVNVISDMLKNDIYLGVYRFQKSKFGKDVDGSRYLISRTRGQIVTGSREKPNHPPIIEGWLFDVVQQKVQANRKKTTLTPHMATGLLRCPFCGAGVHIKYSSGPKRGGPKPTRIEKYMCPKGPRCQFRRLPVADTNDRLWGALSELFTSPERISSLLLNANPDSGAALKEHLAELDATVKSVGGKQDRLLNLYLDGRISKAVYETKNRELERNLAHAQSEAADIRKRIGESGKRELEAELIHTLRILSRSHRRFSEEQKIRVFRSIVKSAHLRDDSVELELYVEPVQNYQWKYLQERKPSQRGTGVLESLRVQIPCAPTATSVEHLQTNAAFS